MSAIEIMDPKMDAGMMCNRESKAIKVNFSIIIYLPNDIINILVYQATKVYLKKLISIGCL
jgi:hypothetical protein